MEVFVVGCIANLSQIGYIVKNPILMIWTGEDDQSMDMELDSC